VQEAPAVTTQLMLASAVTRVLLQQIQQCLSTYEQYNTCHENSLSLAQTENMAPQSLSHQSIALVLLQQLKSLMLLLLAACC
jgi:hypothetical protein